jgi:hypothetical protein
MDVNSGASLNRGANHLLNAFPQTAADVSDLCSSTAQLLHLGVRHVRPASFVFGSSAITYGGQAVHRL